MGTGRALRDPVSLKGEYEYEVNARSPQQDVTRLAQVTDQPGLPCRTGARVRIKIERDGTTDRKERNDSDKMGEGDRTRNLRRQAAMCTSVTRRALPQVPLLALTCLWPSDIRKHQRKPLTPLLCTRL